MMKLTNALLSEIYGYDVELYPRIFMNVDCAVYLGRTKMCSLVYKNP